eukprot:COSAG06_NODE_4286_length_4399_cov_3.887907_5_plen_177_part_00
MRQPPPRWPQKSSAARRTILSPLPKRWLRLEHSLGCRCLGSSGHGRQSRRPVQPTRRLRRVRMRGLAIALAATDASRRSQQLAPRAAAPEVASSCMAARLDGRRDTSSSETRANKPPRADGEQSPRARGCALSLTRVRMRSHQESPENRFSAADIKSGRPHNLPSWQRTYAQFPAW